MGVFMAISLVGFNPEDQSGWLGTIGPVFAAFCSQVMFGHYGTMSLPLVIFLVLLWWITGRKFRIFRWIVGILAVGFFIGFGSGFIGILNGVKSPDWTRCGALLAVMAENAVLYLQPLGTVIVSLTVIIALAVILFNFQLTRLLRALISVFKAVVSFLIRITKLLKKAVISAETVEREEDLIPKPNDYHLDPQTEKEMSGIEDSEAESPTVEDTGSPLYRPDDGAVTDAVPPRELPPIKLLDMPPPDRPEVAAAELEDNARRLEDKLASMRITAKVLKTNPGPIITRYDLEPAADVKIARIVSLADDIAMALKARGVRILAPIPGEAAVGIEIPNRQTQVVYIREIIGSDKFRQAEAPLTIALGKDTRGGIFCTDLARLPHLLIAGATGSGKSVCINVIITSLLYRCDPRNVRLILIDPKKIELSLYAQLSEQHLVSPPGLGEKVITSPENAVKTLQSLHIEMERRYSILAEVGVRSLEEYNRWIDATSDDVINADKRERIPYLVVIIDELADLMLTVRREFEELVARLAQMARAVGIHLIVATQRPSVDVVTGLIKANFPARIAFRVATKVDSRTIIDSMGSEALLGFGDMLLMGIGSSKIRRLHGALVTTEEVESVIEFVRAQPPCDSKFELPDPEIKKITIVGGDENTTTIDTVDELFEEAAKIVVRTEQGSVSVLQRRLRVGYARAARLIDQLEQAGIVGPFDGSKARQVMVAPEELFERYGINL